MYIKGNKFTAREAAFIREYPIDLNGTAAARRAGYNPKSARYVARDLLANPKVRDKIRAALKKRAEATDIKADRVLKELVNIALIDKLQVFTVRDGNVYVTDTDLLPASVRRCISSVSQTQHGIQLKFDDRVKALELLGRHLAMFNDKLTVNDNRSKPIDEMTEAELDAELARLNAEKAAGSQAASQGPSEPA